jgi:glutamate-1-semialdehyde 2,1-aminomutase
LLILRETMPYDALEQRALNLLAAMREAAQRLGVPFWGNALGAMWGFHFTEGPVQNFEQAKTADADYFARFFWGALERGVFLAPSPFEACFISTAHTDGVIDFTINAVTEAMKEAVA